MPKDQTCPCGSGLSRYELKDARGISCGYVCEKCEANKRAKYRPEVFTSSNYWTDEPVEDGDSYGVMPPRGEDY